MHHSWTLAHAEIVTNILDFFSFAFVTPEIVGTARLQLIVSVPKRLLTRISTKPLAQRLGQRIAGGLAFIYVMALVSSKVTEGPFGLLYALLITSLLTIVLTLLYALLLYIKSSRDTAILAFIGIMLFMASRFIGILHGLYT
jgi:hypothetical protein